MIVADVNLVAYLLLGGPHTAAAQRVFQRDAVWAAPILWRSEFRSVLAAYMRHGNLTLQEAARAHELAVSLLSGREFTVSGDRVLDLLAASTCSAYDCEYIALADDLGVPLVTADRQVLRAFADRAVSLTDFAG
ncbi:MAG: type II toxin-antitoxin system VapC family toxin [Gemmatimonadales bacterium]